MEHETERSLTRRSFVQKSVAAGVAISALGAPTAASAFRKTSVYSGKKLDKFNWSFAIPKEDAENTMYYVNKYIFGPQEGIDFIPNGADTASTFLKLTASHFFNASHPSVFLMAILKDQGLPVKVYFDNMNINIFGWAVKPGSPINSPGGLVGKKVAIAVVGWDALWNPIVAGAKADWKKIHYQVVGLGVNPRLDALHSGKVDAIVTWNGEFPVFNAASQNAGKGPLRFISGEQWLKTPANGWAAAEDRLSKDRDLLVRAARAQAKSMWFTKTNPVEAAKIFHKYYPHIANHPGEAEAIAKDYNDTGFTTGPDGTLTHGLGWSSAARWQNLLDVTYEFKLTKNHLKAADMFTNDMVKDINNFDKAEVIKFAKNYKFK
jgi:ABC-type nitrate/sulfonate/bicarbonate transport system substrate-binding protein